MNIRALFLGLILGACASGGIAGGVEFTAIDDNKTGIEIKPIAFLDENCNTVITGSIKGYQTIDYTFTARAGQAISVQLDAKNTANYFNVLPSQSEAAIYIGQVYGNNWQGQIPTAGEYRVRVYLMRSAARRDENADYTLTIGLDSCKG